MGLSSRIAFRFLKSSKWQTTLIVIGISIGISVQLFTGLLIISLQQSLVNTTVGNSSQITVISNLAKSDNIRYYKRYMGEMEQFPEFSVISPTIDYNALTDENNRITPILVRGFDIDLADKIYDIKANIIKGRIPENKNEVIIGKQLAAKLDLEIGDKFAVQVESKNIDHDVKISGIYDFNVRSINELWVITTIRTGQRIFINGKDLVTSIESQVYSQYLFDADTIANKLNNALNDERVTVTNWISQNEDLLTALQSQSISSYFIQGAVLISVVIGIASILAISVLQKSRQLGILKAMGITNRDASKIFLVQGLFFGIFGAIGGFLLGSFLLFGFSFGAGASSIAIVFDFNFIAISLVIVVAATVLASLSPAIKSSRLDPIDIIRGE